jgi:glycine/D-amino acid oxidase-like deaminating enzyme
MTEVATSYWFSQLDPAPRLRAPLAGSREADVCIVGAGFTGLWTAYELLRADPSLEVVVLESELAGFGASGRNGGWCSGTVSASREHWARRGGRGGVVAFERALRETVDEVGRVVEREQIRCDFVKGGTLHVAQSPIQIARLRAVIEEDRAWGLGPTDSILLDSAQSAERIRVEGVLGAHYTPHCARVQPARLVRGLAEAAERAGATIHEGTLVERIAPGVAHASSGHVRARFIVRATEGYTARLPGLHRTLLPMRSAMMVTEPLGESTWTALGWERAETLWDSQHVYVYVQRTADGRIALGGRGTPYSYGSRTDCEGPVSTAVVKALRTRLIELFPPLRDVRVDDAWHGVLAVPRDWAPCVGLDRSTGLAWAGGYVGEGVAASNLAGRTLRDLLLDRDTELARLPWVSPFARAWEPEPFRFIGVRGVHALMSAADRRERATGRGSLFARVGNLIAGH